MNQTRLVSDRRLTLGAGLSLIGAILMLGNITLEDGGVLSSVIFVSLLISFVGNVYKLRE